MNWSRELGIWEYAFIAAFGLAYLLYFARLFYRTKNLGVLSRSTILKLLLRGFYLTLIIWAIMGPLIGSQTTAEQQSAKEIHLAIDVSKSMDVTDIQPTRLEKLKFEILKILPTLNASRVSISIFSTEAFCLLPLTADIDAQRSYLEAVNTDMISEGGTDLPALIDYYLKDSTTRPRVLLIFTDGETTLQPSYSSIQILKTKGYISYMVGVGHPLGGTVAQTTTLSSPDYEGLSSLSKSFGTALFKLDAYEKDLSTLSAAINALKFPTSTGDTIVANRFQLLIALALILMVIDVLWTIRTMKI